MNFSRNDSKSDPKQNAGHATVTVPTTPDVNKGKGPAQADQKGNDANKPVVQAPGPASALKGDGPDGNRDAKTDKQATGSIGSDDKAGSESMVSEGGHATLGQPHNAVREPDSSVAAQNEPSKGSADGAADKPGLSAKSAS